MINADFPSYNFDVIDGVSYQVDLTQPAKYTSRGELQNADANRIQNLQFNGQPVDPEQKFIVATNNYRGGGGGRFPGIGPDKVIFQAPDTNRDVIVRYIVEQGNINPSADGNWRFAPVKEATALFSTGPKATRFVDDVKDVTIEPAGEGAKRLCPLPHHTLT